MPNLGLLDYLGVLGAVLYMVNYLRLVLRWSSTNQTNYFVVNLTAASLVLTGLSHNFNLGAVMIQTFFIAMSLIGIGRSVPGWQRLRRRDRLQVTGSAEPPASAVVLCTRSRAQATSRDAHGRGW